MRNVVKLGAHFLLLCCATAALAQFQAPQATNNILPVRTLRGYLMIVAVSINDCGPFDFLVDTGTNTTLLDPRLAAELALKPKDRLQLASLANSASVPRYFLQKVRVGPAALSGLEALATPLPQLRAQDPNIRGILGMNFLLHFSFRLDFDRPALELYPFPESARIPAGLRVPVQINESRLLIAVASQSAPKGAWKLALDSGISQFLVFAERIPSPQGNADRCSQADCVMRVSTNLAEHPASVRLLRDLIVSEARLPEQEVVVLRNNLEKSSDPQDGLFPAAPFHSVFFDRTTASLIFSPSPAVLSVASADPH
jgi:hypothetical protein